MPRQRIPKLCHHRPTGRAYVTDQATGREVYLGAWGSAEAQIAYGQWVAALQARRREVPIEVRAGHAPTVSELVAAYLAHADGYYTKHGRPTTEAGTVRQATGFLFDLYPDLPAKDFGPGALKAVRQAMVEKGHARIHVNKQVQRLRRIWRWGVEHELVSADVWSALRSVQGLAAGRTAAKESEPVLPADPAAVAAALPLMPPTLRAMVSVQLFSGCRPQDTCILRPIDIECNTEPWVYTPLTHKTEHRGRPRKIWLGPQARAVLAPLLAKAKPEDWLFRHRRGRYTTQAYRRAIDRVLERHGLPLWSPGQLRHTQATAVRSRFGLEAAQVYLGHAEADVTQIYAERNEALARKVAEEMG